MYFYAVKRSNLESYVKINVVFNRYISSEKNEVFVNFINTFLKLEGKRDKGNSARGSQLTVILPKYGRIFLAFLCIFRALFK